MCLPINLPFYLTTHIPVYLHSYLPANLYNTYLHGLLYRTIYQPIYLPTCLATNLPMYILPYLLSYLSYYLFAYLFAWWRVAVPVGYPRIVESPSLKAVEKDRSTTMVCSATGSPEPTVSWMKDYIPVDVTDPRLKILPTGNRNL